MSRQEIISYRQSFPIVFAALIVTGCSGSGGASPAGQSNVAASNDTNLLNEVTSSQVSSDASNVIAALPEVQSPQTLEDASNIDSNSELQNSTQVSSQQDELPSDAVSNQVTNAVQSTESESTEDSVPEEQVRLTTEVFFDINVPVYQSNALQVQLRWGDVALSANWIGDELWQASDNFPTDTENLLSVVFFDENGDIELASYEQVYKTGINAAESIQINVEQFNADQFDIDDDGTSNLDELIAGSDPRVDEYSQFEIQDSVELDGDILGVSQGLEARLDEARPQVETDVGDTQSTRINIDEGGNGTVSFGTFFPWYTENHSGTRTNTGNSIQWGGSFSTDDRDWRRFRDFTSEVIWVDDTTRKFTETITESYSGTWRDTWDISSDITGEIVEGTNRCKPLFGTMRFVFGSNSSQPFNTSSTTVSKKEGDLYWKVVVESSIQGIISEYLAREIGLRYTKHDLDFPTFMCELADL